MEIPVELPLDSDGFLRRECPSCGDEFKWHYGPTDSRPDGIVDPPLYTCPLCGAKADGDRWFTQDQVRYQQQLVEFYMFDAVNDEMKRAFRSSKNIRYEPGRNPASAPAALHEPNDMIIIEPPCHPWEPVKVPKECADGGPLYCLMCGEIYSA